jgi:hypothetical protein
MSILVIRRPIGEELMNYKIISLHESEVRGQVACGA